MSMNREGVALLRALIFKMWSLNQARENGDCGTIAGEVNLWMPPDMQITAADVHAALGRVDPTTATLNSAVLREKIDRMPVLYSARISGDYQAILNEIIADPECAGATLADVVEAMAMRRVPQPTNIVSGAATLVGTSNLG